MLSADDVFMTSNARAACIDGSDCYKLSDFMFETLSEAGLSSSVARGCGTWLRQGSLPKMPMNCTVEI
jgi:hypothetical protein